MKETIIEYNIKTGEEIISQVEISKEELNEREKEQERIKLSDELSEKQGYLNSTDYLDNQRSRETLLIEQEIIDEYSLTFEDYLEIQKKRYETNIRVREIIKLLDEKN